jgi:thiol-disulfide isomerase/thioredoxin
MKLPKVITYFLLLCSAAQAKPTAPPPIAPDALKKQIAASKGRVVLVNFWATWCAPCVAEVPLLARLQTRNAKKLQVILVSADAASDGSKAGQVLAQKGWKGASFIIGGNPFEFAEKFDPKAGDFALPRSYLYDKNGKLVKIIATSEAEKLEKIVLAQLRK